MALPDLVLSLTALGAVLAMTAVVLEEASALEQAEEAVLHMQRQIQRVRQLQQQQQQGREGAREGGLLRELPWQQERFLQEQEQDLQVTLFRCFCGVQLLRVFSHPSLVSIVLSSAMVLCLPDA